MGGDIIVEFAGQKIANIYDYTYALDAVTIGKEIRIVVRRDGKLRLCLPHRRPENSLCVNSLVCIGQATIEDGKVVIGKSIEIGNDNFRRPRFGYLPKCSTHSRTSVPRPFMPIGLNLRAEKSRTNVGVRCRHASITFQQ